MMNTEYSFIEISFHGKIEIYQRKIFLDCVTFSDYKVIPIIHETTNKLVEELGII